MVEVKVPEVGESITEGFLSEWLVQDGQAVDKGTPLFELETDKITMTIEADEAGVVSIAVEAGEEVRVGQVVGRIDPEAKPSTDPEPETEPETEPDPEPDPEPETETESEPESDRSHEPELKTQDSRLKTPHKTPKDGPPLSAPAGMPQLREKLDAADPPLSPAVRRMMAEHELAPDAVTGSGKGGRISKEDVQTQLDGAGSEPETEPGADAEADAESKAEAPAAPPKAESGPQPATAMPTSAERRETRKRMSPIRYRIAERLVKSQQDTATLTTFNECDMSAVMAWRSRHQAAFEQAHGMRLGFMSFFVKAAVDALKAVPALNSRLEGDELVQQHYYDIGVAVSTDRGLIVPVIRDADQKSFAEIEATVGGFAERARTGGITLPELQGGSFTISNGGVFGSLLSTPILNPPQAGILGLHAIKKRPMVVDDELQVKPMMYLAMSYDHRLADGKQSVTFLKRIVACIEHPERMMLEV